MLGEDARSPDRLTSHILALDYKMPTSLRCVKLLINERTPNFLSRTSGNAVAEMVVGLKIRFRDSRT